MTHARFEAEDLVQDAVLAILGANASWERSYLFATIRNRFIDQYRRSRKIAFVALEHDDGTAIDPPDLAFEIPDVLETDVLERALGQLRPDEREALFLAVVEGYTADEIGKLTSKPRGTILSLLHRAKKKLRQLLGGDGGDLACASSERAITTIEGVMAAQILYVDPEGEPCTLYQARAVDKLARVIPGEHVIDGLHVNVWREKGLVMVLTRPAA